MIVGANCTTFRAEAVPRLPGPAVGPKGPKLGQKNGAGFIMFSSLMSAKISNGSAGFCPGPNRCMWIFGQGPKKTGHIRARAASGSVLTTVAEGRSLCVSWLVCGLCLHLQWRATVPRGKTINIRRPGPGPKILNRTPRWSKRPPPNPENQCPTPLQYPTPPWPHFG